MTKVELQDKLDAVESAFESVMEDNQDILEMNVKMSQELIEAQCEIAYLKGVLTGKKRRFLNNPDHSKCNHKTDMLKFAAKQIDEWCEKNDVKIEKGDPDDN